jgi:ADP-heptose:LPS heptosyltransferase
MNYTVGAMDNHSNKRILVKRSDAIGDVLLASAVLPLLAERYSGYAIDFATSFPEIFENNPYVNHAAKPESFVDTEYHKIFDLNLAYERRPYVSILAAYAQIVDAAEDDMHLAFRVPDHAQKAAVDILATNGIQTANLIALQSSASFWVKNWAPESFEKLLHELSVKFPIRFVLLGIPEDPYIQGAFDLRGKCGIVESAAILEKCRGFIGLDSSLLHFAKALGIPVAGLFGHSNPALRIKINNKDCIIISSASCKFCHHRQQTPLSIPVCEKQMPLFRIFDSFMQVAFRRWYTRHDKYALFIANKLFRSLRWREKGRRIAFCMKTIDESVVQDRLENWLEGIKIRKGL